LIKKKHFQTFEARQLLTMAFIVEKNKKKIEEEFTKGSNMESLEKLKILNEKIKEDLNFYNQFFDDSTLYS